MKNLEIFNIHIEESLKNKTNICEKNEELISQLNQKINIMKIEIEELILHNEDLKNELKLFTNKFEKLKSNMLEKDKDLNILRKSIKDIHLYEGFSKNITERNRDSYFTLEENTLGSHARNTCLQNNFNSSITIESANKDDKEVKTFKTKTDDKFSTNELEDINRNNKENPKKNYIPSKNFVSSTGYEDITQYNTAVSYTSNNIKTKCDKKKNLNNLMIDYLKNVI